MIQHYQSLKFNIEEYNKSSQDSQAGRELSWGQIQKAFSTSHLICLVIRYPGKTRYLYFGRGNSYEGVWEFDSPPPPPLRVRDRFLEYIRKHLVGSRVSVLELDKKDRIVHIAMKGKERESVFSLFWKGRQSYFAYAVNEKQKSELFCSWEKSKKSLDPKADLALSIMERLDSIGRKQLKQEKPAEIKSTLEIKGYFEAQLKSLTKSPGSKRKRKYYKRKLMRIGEDLEKILTWNDLKKTIEEPEFTFEDNFKQTICGIKFKFPHQSTEFQKRDLVYLKIKAFKKAESFLKDRLEKSQLEFEKWDNGQLEVNGEENILRRKICSPVWAKVERADNRNKKENSTKTQSGIVEFDLNLESGEKIRGALGKNIHANDHLRSVWASKKHFWFHLEGMKSGHCILRSEDIGELKERDYEALGSMLRDYAKFEILEVPLVFTQVKYLKGLKGQAGAVTFKKARYRKVTYRNNWTEIISLH